MDNQKDPLLNAEDYVNAENNLLKIKLGLEYNMEMHELSKLDPAIENQWLKSVYAFEQQYRDARRVTLYEYIGRPPFRKCDTLTNEEVQHELRQLQSVMGQNGVALDCICEYDDAVIYRFITEELFQHEMDEMRIPGMTCHFIYEEFHPNHGYDLRYKATDFIKAIFTRAWKEEYEGLALADKVSFGGVDHDRSRMSTIIMAFQQAHVCFRVQQLKINEVVIDEGITTAQVRGSLAVSGKLEGGVNVRYEGACSFRFSRDGDYWVITEFSLPGLGSRDD